MNGYVNIPDKNRRFPYTFEDGIITVYSRDSLPLDETHLPIIKDLKAKSPFIVGTDLETQNPILFFIDIIPFSDEYGAIWTSTSKKVYYYISLHPSVESFLIDRMTFEFSELDYFFNLRRGLNIKITNPDRTFGLQTIPCKDVQKAFSFLLNGQKIDCDLGISQTLKTNANTPLFLKSSFGCEFKSTTDVSLMLHLYSIVKRLFCFLCYRKSICISPITLYEKDRNNRRSKIGELHILFEHIENKEADKIIQKTIEYKYVQRLLPQLTQLIANHNLYFEHIPNTDDEAHHVTIARVILNTAAFEWTFWQCYKKFTVSEYRTQVKNDILTFLDEMPTIKSYNSKKKSEATKYKKIVSNVDSSLSEKIHHALNDCDSILSAFIKAIRNLNDVEDEAYSKIANRLQTQRNNFAHGNIDKEMNDNIILDTIILEWLNYCIVLKSIRYSDDEIFNIINQIFKRNFSDKIIEPLEGVVE